MTGWIRFRPAKIQSMAPPKPTWNGWTRLANLSPSDVLTGPPKVQLGRESHELGVSIPDARPRAGVASTLRTEGCVDPSCSSCISAFARWSAVTIRSSLNLLVRNPLRSSVSDPDAGIRPSATD